MVEIYDVGLWEETGKGATSRWSWSAGRSLREQLKDPDLPRVDCLRAMASALAAAHERGIVHRDLKPENVIVAEDGRVKVVDFGLARRAATTTTTTTLDDIADTLETSRAGTPAYIAPEVMLGKPADARSDQFAWGVTAYEGARG